MSLNVIRGSGGKLCPKEEVNAWGHPAPPTHAIRNSPLGRTTGRATCSGRSLCGRRARGTATSSQPINQASRRKGCCLHSHAQPGHAGAHTTSHTSADTRTDGTASTAPTRASAYCTPPNAGAASTSATSPAITRLRTPASASRIHSQRSLGVGAVPDQPAPRSQWPLFPVVQPGAHQRGSEIRRVELRK
jgi:hypothetical protein